MITATGLHHQKAAYGTKSHKKRQTCFPEVAFDMYREDSKQFILIALDGLIGDDK